MTEGPLLPTPPPSPHPPPHPAPTSDMSGGAGGLPCRTEHCLISCIVTPRGETGRLLEDSSKDLGFTLNGPVSVSLVAAGE